MLQAPRAGGEEGASATPTSQVIGSIKTAIGSASITRASGIAVQINVGDPVCAGDLIETAADGRVGISFIDGTWFDLTGSTAMVLNEFVCEADGRLRSALFGIVRGAFKFIAGRVTEPGCLKIETPFALLRASARASGIGALSLTALIFSALKQAEAASSELTFLDDEKINYSDLDHGVFELITKDGRHIIVDNPGQTIVLSATGSLSVVTNSPEQMAELQTFQQNALGLYAQATTNPTSTGGGGGGSSTPPDQLFSPEGLQPINFIEPSAPTPTQQAPSQAPITVVEATVNQSIAVPVASPAVTSPTPAVTASAPSPPLLTATTGPIDIDTASFDTFTPTVGTFTVINLNSGTTLTYGIVGGTTGGNTVLGGVTYDVSDVGPYGTLYLNSSTGAYTYYPNTAEINALTAPETETFIITVSDGTLTSQQTFTVTLDGVNDAPTLQAVTGATFNDTPAVDHFSPVTGTLVAADVDRPAQTLTYGIVGGGEDLSVNGYNESLTGSFGKLYVNTATGAYTFVPNDTAINALTAL